MGFGANFTKVTFRQDNQGTAVLEVEGQSDPELLRRVSEMRVALLLRPEELLPNGEGAAAAQLPRTAPVEHVGDSADWRVTVPQQQDPGANVLVIGKADLAAAADGDVLTSPFLWSMIVPVAR